MLALCWPTISVQGFQAWLLFIFLTLLKWFKKCLFCLRADAFNIVEFGV